MIFVVVNSFKFHIDRSQRQVDIHRVRRVDVSTQYGIFALVIYIYYDLFEAGGGMKGLNITLLDHHDYFDHITRFYD